ncbi:hypothetical protein GCM10023347_49040 [Streptomyces chumphonensis]|uniref:DUF397 domain-containing protein n=1 Tax=Streptomyces chumphonensis TaxID=1214925 RepID=A0A927IEE5_9ACTN|nr:DUF397 domain-containing protein [Streptomyces chumphonensis]MBD3933271.1 DUF397 domain-containing protein [Streptomyces chumphonensis]
MAIRQGRTTGWVKSSYSGANACVEVRSPVRASVAVRDSKDPKGPFLAFAPASWTSFVGAVDGGALGRA